MQTAVYLLITLYASEAAETIPQPVSSGSTFLLLYPLYDPPLYDPPDPPLYDPPDPKEGCN